MDNSTVESLQKVFTSRLFRVPDYQRGYAWESRQIQDLLDDLEWLAEGKVHYTGTLVLQEARSVPKRMDNAGQSYATYDLVDGQQRLTTIVLLLDAIRRQLETLGNHRDLVTGIARSYVTTADLNGQPMPKLTLNRDCQGFFYENVLGLLPGVGGPRIRSHVLLDEARNRLDNYLAGQAQKRGAAYDDWLLRLYAKVTQQLEFMVYPVGSEADAGVIFETMNDRGKQLTELEKVKNYLLYLASKMVLPAEHDLVRMINEAWAHIFETLMASNLTGTEHEDRLLRAHWLMVYNYKPEEWQGSRSIKTRFALGTFQADHAELLRALQHYVVSLRNAATAYCEAYEPGSSHAFGDVTDLAARVSLIRSTSRLGRMRLVAPFLPLLIATRLRYPGDAGRSQEVVDLCERFAFRVYQFRGLRSDTGQSTLFRLGYNLYNGTTFDAVVADLRRSLHGYCSDQQFAARFVLGDEPGDWYGWGGLRYLLYEYEEHLATQQKLPVKMPWEEIDRRDKKDTVEHVLPQHPAETGYWVDHFTPEQRRKYTHDIGNLCLTYYNPTLGNKPFPEKRGRLGQPNTYAESYLFSERELAACDEWTEAELLARRERIQDWALWRWHVDAAPPQPGLAGIDAIQAQATQHGVADVFETLLEAAEGHDLYPRPYVRGLMFTPPRKRTRALFSIWPQAGSIQTGVWFKAFAEFYPLKTDEVQEILGANEWRGLTMQNVGDFVARLNELFALIEQRRSGETYHG